MENNVLFDRPLIIVTAAMGRRGETGVQTHFNDFIAYLLEKDYPVLFIGPDEARIAYMHLSLLNSVVGRLIPVLGQLAHSALRRIAFYTTQRELRRRLAGHSTWCVYAQDPITARAALSLRRRAGQRVILAAHYNRSQADEMANRGTIKRRGWLYRQILNEERQVLASVDKIVVFSHFMRDEIVKNVPKEERIHVIPNTACTPTPSVDAVSCDLIAIGSLEPRKNQEFLLRVLCEAKRMNYEYTLSVVGSGEDMKRLEALSSELGIARQIFFLGRRENAASLLYAHRLLVHAARIENLPIALIESLAAGIPIMAPHVGGIPEVFSDGVEGRFWNLDDVHASALLLIHVLEDELTRSQMGRSARRRYLSQFSCEQVFASIAEVVYGKPLQI